MAAPPLTPNLLDHDMIVPYQTTNNTTEETASIVEKGGQQFLEGVPVMLGADGYIIEWDGATVAGGSGTGIAGISRQPGANLGSDGAGAPPQPWGSVGFPGATTTFGQVDHQVNAVNIPMGAPPSDGRHTFAKANDQTIFIGQVDNSAGAVAADWTPVIADVTKQFGLTKDASGHWYVDRGKTTAGVDTAVIVLGLDPITGSVPNGRVRFRFLDSVCQLAH